MTRRRGVLWIAGFALLSVATVLLIDTSREIGGASTLSRRASGWLAAERILAETGTLTEKLDRPPSPETDHGVLVIAFPTLLPIMPDELEAVSELVDGGSTLIFGYSRSIREYSEIVLMEELEIEASRFDHRLPLNPLRWWREAREGWTIAPVGGGTAIELSRPRRIPLPPERAKVLYADSGQREAVFAVGRGSGRVIFVPAEALSNARIGTDGGAELLARLQGSLGSPWVFDEYHQGLTTGRPETDGAHTLSMDLLILQAVLGYALALIALMRRFGPAWDEPVVATGSTGSFLIDLGWFHDRQNHHAEAARLLVERSIELDPRIRPPSSIEEVDDGPRLVELARRLDRDETE
jgi:hypothetical protein